nr:retrovirus-related Pol polyprotein from transposon TNT 1-94 [Tanacetum cinerariifolium]
DINIDALYNILKQNQGDVNDAMGLNKKTVVVTFDPLALIAEKTKVSKSKEKVVVSLVSEGSDADDFSELKKITAFDSDQEINANMVFMAQIKKVLSDSEASSSSADDKISEIADQEVLYDKISVQLVELDKHVRDLKNTVLEKDFKISDLEECVRIKDLEIEKCLERLNVCENKLYKMGQTNQTVHMIIPLKDNLYNGRKGIGFENLSYFEKAKDLRPTLYDEKVIGLGYTLMFLTHSDEALEIEKFKRSRENKIEFAYDYGNLNAQKIIIDLEDEAVSLLEKEKANLKTIESLKSKGFESSENAISESENQSENDCQVVEKECHTVENSKVIAPGMFKLSVSQSVENKLKRKRRCSKHMTGNRALLTNFVENFLGTVRFGNNDFAVIAGYGDVVIGSMTIKKVYYAEGLGHNLFSVGQFCDKGLEVAFRKSTCFVRNEDGVDLLIGDHSSNLYTIALNEIASNSSTCLLAKTSSSQSWLWHQLQRVRTNGTKFKNKTLAKFFDEVGITQQFSAARTPQQNGVVERRNRTLVEAARTMLTFANLPLFLWAEAIATAYFTQNQSASFKIYNKRTHKIHESVNMNFDEISEMASTQFSLEPGLSNLNKTRKSSNQSVSQVSEASKKDLEDLVLNFYDEYFDSSKIMQSSTTNVETSINEKVFHEVFELFQGESSLSSLNDDVQQSSKEVGDETFAPVDRIEAIRLFLPYVAHKDFTAFVSKQYPDHVYALDKALYGLKQAPQAWYDVLSQFLIDNDFQKGSIDTTLFIKKKGKHIVLIQIYVDEIIFGSTNLKYCTKFSDLMVKCFEISMMGEMKFFLRLRVNQFSNEIFINQSKYILDILKRFGMENYDTVPTPMVEQANLKLDLVGKLVDHIDYRIMIGSLMYVNSSRPYIMFATCMCARYQTNPNKHNVLAVKSIFHYLKGTINLGLWYLKDSGFDLTAYSNADHTGCHLDRKSTSGSVQFLGDKLVCWSSKKQNCVSISIAESEYVAVSSYCAKVLWMRTQLTNYGFFYDKVPIYCDSESEIAISCNPVQHTRTKHIDVRYHFIKDHVEKGTIELYFVGTEYQLADLFTKALLEARFKFLVEKLGMMSRET